MMAKGAPTTLSTTFIIPTMMSSFYSMQVDAEGMEQHRPPAHQ